MTVAGGRVEAGDPLGGDALLREPEFAVGALGDALGRHQPREAGGEAGGVLGDRAAAG